MVWSLKCQDVISANLVGRRTKHWRRLIFIDVISDCDSMNDYECQECKSTLVDCVYNKEKTPPLSTFSLWRELGLWTLKKF